MLLTIISLIDSGDIWENVIRPTDKVRAIFEALWQNYVPKESPFAVAPWTPFWHLKNEPFWHWVTEGSTTEAYLDDDLYYLLCHDKSARIALKNTLFDML